MYRGKSRTLFAAVTLATSLIFSAGCGSTNGTTSAPNFSNPSQAAIEQQRNFILGRVQLDQPFVEGRVEIKDLQGNLVHAFTTKENGWFWGPGYLPADFTVLAYQGNQVYRRENRGGWSTGTLYVNAGTTLLSAYHRQHPELTLDQAEVRLLTHYKLPRKYRMGWVSQVYDHHFDPAEFFRGVQTAGGLDSYLSAEIGRIDTVILPSIIAEMLADAAKVLGITTAEALGSATITNIAGSISSRLGYNFTTAGALQNISNQLDDIAKQITDLNNALTKYATVEQLKSTLKPLDDAALAIDTQIKTLRDEVSAFNATHPSESDLNVPSNQLSQPEYTQTELDIRASLLQQRVVSLNQLTTTIQNGILTGNAQHQYTLTKYNSCSFQDANQFHSYPWRQNSTTRELAELVGKYTAVLGEAIVLYSEIGQSAYPPAYAAQLQLAKSNCERMAPIIQQAEMFVPDLLASDEVMVDMKERVLWYNQIMPAATYGDAYNIAVQLRVGPYGEEREGWYFHLPSATQVDHILHHRVGPTASIPPSGSWVDVSPSGIKASFERLGFNVANYGNVQSGPFGSSDNQGSWIDRQLVSSTDPNFFTWNGDGSNPHQEVYDDDTVKAPFIICAEYPNTDSEVVQDAGGDPDMNSLNTVSQQSPWSTAYVSDPPTIKEGTKTEFGVQLKCEKYFDSPNQPGGRYGTGAWDITNRVSSNTDNERIASVSNYASPIVPAAELTAEQLEAAGPGPAGLLTWHPPIFSNEPALVPLRVYAAIVGGSDNNGGNQINYAEQTVTPPAGLQATVKQVFFQPRNTRYDTSTPIHIPFYLTAYMRDGRMIDVSNTNNTTWRAILPNGQEISDPAVCAFSSSSPKNELFISPNLPPGVTTLKIRVEFNPAGYGLLKNNGVVIDEGDIALRR